MILLLIKNELCEPLYEDNIEKHVCYKGENQLRKVSTA